MIETRPTWLLRTRPYACFNTSFPGLYIARCRLVHGQFNLRLEDASPRRSFNFPLRARSSTSSLAIPKPQKDMVSSLSNEVDASCCLISRKLTAVRRVQSQPPSSAQKRARSPSPRRQSSPTGPIEPQAGRRNQLPPSSAPPSSLPASSPPAGFSDFDDDGVENGIPLDVTDGEEGEGEDLFGDEMVE